MIWIITDKTVVICCHQKSGNGSITSLNSTQHGLIAKNARTYVTAMQSGLLYNRGYPLALVLQGKQWAKCQNDS